MELALNLVWLLLAALMICAWLRFGQRSGARQSGIDRRWQFVALTVLILILLPVISVTDDLMAVQNPAEVDSSLRKDNGDMNPHSVVPAAAQLPLSAFSGLFCAILGSATPNYRPASHVALPALASIQNRPPPTA